MRKVTKWPIQTTATWSLGFSVYIGVMAMKHPERVPDLAAYMALIIQASWQFKGTPWQDYDTQFRMQVAAAKCSHLAVGYRCTSPRSHPHENRALLSREGKRGTTEHKYRSSCTSQDSCSRSKTGIKSVTLHQQHNCHQATKQFSTT